MKYLFNRKANRIDMLAIGLLMSFTFTGYIVIGVTITLTCMVISVWGERKIKSIEYKNL